MGVTIPSKERWTIYHKQPGKLNPVAHDTALQDRLLDYCRDRSGMSLP